MAGLHEEAEREYLKLLDINPLDYSVGFLLAETRAILNSISRVETAVNVVGEVDPSSDSNPTSSPDPSSNPSSNPSSSSSPDPFARINNAFVKVSDHFVDDYAGFIPPQAQPHINTDIPSGTRWYPTIVTKLPTEEVCFLRDLLCFAVRS